jgi:two-component system, OmpR family, alkaline phosphatase synthesis response regulator PhoP
MKTNKLKKNNSVMIVEDDAIVARMLAHTLSQRGFSVNLASDGKMAVESIIGQPPPSLVLLDIILPFFDGFEVLEKIRNQKNWKNVPIIMLTSKTQEPSVVRAFDAGANDYVTKPFQIEELMARIRRLMR